MQRNAEAVRTLAHAIGGCVVDDDRRVFGRLWIADREEQHVGVRGRRSNRRHFQTHEQFVMPYR